MMYRIEVFTYDYGDGDYFGQISLVKLKDIKFDSFVTFIKAVANNYRTKFGGDEWLLYCGQNLRCYEPFELSKIEGGIF